MFSLGRWLGLGNTRAAGNAGEDRALAHLQARGLKLLVRNYRVGGGPHRPAGEIDLILRERDGTLVFVEVRWRRDSSHGGAAATVSKTKQRHLVHAAKAYLLQFATPPRCRFDVIAIDGDELEWLKGAFEAG